MKGWILIATSAAKAVYPEAGKCFRNTRKLYPQPLRFASDYQSNDDVSLDPGDNVPFACTFPSHEAQLGLNDTSFDQFAADEIVDHLEALGTVLIQEGEFRFPASSRRISRPARIGSSRCPA